MARRTRSLLVQLGSFVLAGGLLYLALRNVDFAEMAEVLREARFAWLVPLVVVTLLAHLVRAWRWQALLDAIPVRRDTPTERASLKLAFYSVMIGYMVNNAAPRLGEPVRAANVASQTRLRFGSVFGSVFGERVLDVLSLGLGLALVVPVLFVRQRERIGALLGTFWPDGVDPVYLVLFGVLAVVVAVAVLVIYRRYLVDSAAEHGTGWTDRAVHAFRSFADGALTLWHTRRRLFLVGTTVLIWGVGYLLMAYVPLVLLGMQTAYDLSLFDAAVIMLFGSIGFAIPSPGGIGSYHYVSIQTLTLLYGVDAATAATYAVLTHTAQLVLHTLAGAVCLLLQGASLRTLRANAEAAKHAPTEHAPPAPHAPVETDFGPSA